MKQFGKMLELTCPDNMLPYLKRIRFDIAFLLSLLFSVVTAFLCTNKDGGIDAYMSIALPYFAIYLFVFILSQAVGSSITFTCSSVYFISLGVSLQLILNPTTANASNLCLYTFLGLLLGIVLTVAMYYLLKVKRKKLYIFFTVTTILLYVSLFILGVSEGGTRAWISLFGFEFQMTEITKVFAVIQITLLTNDEFLSDKKRVIYPALIVLLHSFFFVSISELGTLLVIGFTYILTSFIFLNKESVKFFTITIVVFIFITALITLTCYLCYKSNAQSSIFATLGSIFQKVKHRVILITDPSTLDYDSTYQLNQIKNCLSVAKWFGSEVDIYVPVIESDLVVLHLISTFGLFSFIATVIVQMILFHSGLTRLTKNCNSLSAVAISFISMQSINALISTASALAIIPLVGLGYPLLSKGGTGLSVNTAMIIFSIFSMMQFAPSKAIAQTKGGKLCRESASM